MYNMKKLILQASPLRPICMYLITTTTIIIVTYKHNNIYKYNNNNNITILLILIIIIYLVVVEPLEVVECNTDALEISSARE